jgi:hypothetical protein
MRGAWRGKLTYANVMSTIAAFLALTGGATAIALSLPKNSVTSKQIAKGAVKRVDIAKDAVTGDKVNEATLGKVNAAIRADTAGQADKALLADKATTADTAGRADSAATADTAASAATAVTANSIGGLPAANIAKSLSTSSAFFITDLPLTVPGFGTFRLVCEINAASNSDDEVTFGYSTSSGLPASTIAGGFSSSAGFPLDTPVSRVIGDSEATGTGTFTNQNDRVYYAYRLAVPGTSRALVIEASGLDNESNPGCAGQIQAFAFS